MIYTAQQKVPNGKLAKVKIDCTDSKISSLQITGDFFIHPEEKIKEIEELFNDLDINFEQNIGLLKVKNLIKKENIVMIGITPEFLVDLIKNAIANSD